MTQCLRQQLVLDQLIFVGGLNMREWYIDRVNGDVYELQQELNSFEGDERYKVQQVLYVDGQYQILYTKE